MNDEYAISIAFHKKYYNELYGHLVKVYLKDGNIVEGVFCDEFYDDGSILISPKGNEVKIIKISDIELMELSQNVY